MTKKVIVIVRVHNNEFNRVVLERALDYCSSTNADLKREQENKK